MADNWIQEQTRLRQRRDQKNVGISKGVPFLGLVTGPHNPDNERVTVTYHGGTRKLRTLHPYTGRDSWIRVGMEASQEVIMAQRSDSQEPELLAYAFRNPEDRVESFSKGQGLYRPLTAGEMDFHSKGMAQTYYSRRPLLEQRGGLIRSWLNQDELQSGARSPVHVRQLHLNKSDAIGDEERVGVVQRPDGVLKTKFIKSERLIDPALAADVAATAATTGVVPEPGPFAKEHLLVLKSGATIPSPEVLVDVRQGDVVDDDGNFVNLSATGKPLRFKAEYFTESTLGGVVFLGIDDQGNWSAHFPDEAETGGDLKIPAGDLLTQIGKNWLNTVQDNFSLTCVEGGITVECKADHNTQVTEGQMVITIADSTYLLEALKEITIRSDEAVHTVVGGTEIHVEDGKIELGAEGGGDKAVLDSALQAELTLISAAFTQFVGEFNLHFHPLPDYILPLIPLGSTGPTIPGVVPGGPPMISLLPSATSYSPGATASGLVTIDS